MTDEPFVPFDELPPELQALLRAQHEQPDGAQQAPTRPASWGQEASPARKTEILAALARRREERRRTLEQLRHTQAGGQEDLISPDALDAVRLDALPGALAEQARQFLDERRQYRPPDDEALATQLAGYDDDMLRREWELLLHQRKAAMDTRSEEAAKAIGLRLQRVYEAMKLHGFAGGELDQRVEQWSFETIAQKQLTADWAVHSGRPIPVLQRSYRLYAHDYAVEFSSYQLGDGRWVLGTYTGQLFNIDDREEERLLAWARQFFWLLSAWLNLSGVPARHFLPDLTLHEHGWQPTQAAAPDGPEPEDDDGDMEYPDDDHPEDDDD